MTHPALTIRPYQSTDERAVIQLWVDCELVKPWNNPQQDIARKLLVQPEGFLVGEVGGKVVASVMAGYEGHRGWVNYLAVEPSCRRHGYGVRMMDAVEVYLRKAGAPKINLQVRSSNKTVIAFYEAIGYKLDEVVSFGKRLVEDDPAKG